MWYTFTEATRRQEGGGLSEDGKTDLQGVFPMNETKTQRLAQTLTMAAMLTVLGFVLPFFTGQIPQIGGMLCPMPLPVLLCGLLCGCLARLGCLQCRPLFCRFLLGRLTFCRFTQSFLLSKLLYRIFSVLFTGLSFSSGSSLRLSSLQLSL